MDDEHKVKLAQGRKDARAVKAYLMYLEEHKPRRGRRRTKESISARLEAIPSELEDATPLARLNLIQEQMNLEAELLTIDEVVDARELRAAFVAAAPRYASSKGISREAIRQVGVEAATIREAGIK